MSALLFNFLSIEMQYLCSVALILICALTGSLLYMMRERKTDEPNAANTNPSVHDDLAAEEPSEELSEQASEELSEEPSKELSEEPSEELLEEPLEELSEEPSGELLKEPSEELSPTDSENPNLVDFERREQVSVAEIGDLISDEVAVSFMEEAEEADQTVFTKPKGIINVDTLSKNYQPNETVTLESLKEKKLIGNSVNYVKVLARGVLNKPLIVKMPEFSVEAVKMILLTGGKAIKLKTKRE